MERIPNFETCFCENKRLEVFSEAPPNIQSLINGFQASPSYHGNNIDISACTGDAASDTEVRQMEKRQTPLKYFVHSEIKQ